MSYSAAPISLLYVEDDIVTGMILHRILSSTFSHLVIHTAHSGEDGIKMYREHGHDIVVSDIMMPGLDGMQMVREIQRLAPETLCIFTTAKTGDANFLVQAQKLSRMRLYFKPTDCSELIRGIRECIDTIMTRRSRTLLFSMNFQGAVADNRVTRRARQSRFSL
ncbi:response regulator transcription factor [Geobacter sp. SVR]|uniref:response regulator transcription factor n=1 Tax=Geobacter sp. SVR TaxID=2495594 RepID=UPI00143EF972|nr:response regulator [Geobacter sp. SVR]GCF85540.1 hypothetical protein GSbR_21400 [Geobacter sp. SVR]